MKEVSSGLEIRLLGLPRLLLNGQSVDGLRRKNLALVYYLAAQDRRTTREKLLDFFWPDHERAAAQAILRTMIHDLRSHLGKYFFADDRIVELSSETVIDLNTFTAALKSPSPDLQNLTEALSLYQGDFIEGFSLAEPPQFDEWVISEREHYRVMAMNGFASQARLYEARLDVTGAMEAMRHALVFNPFQEELQRDAMRLLYLNGDRAGVIRQYETLRKLLDEEMGVPPMPETRALYDSIINDHFVALPAQPIRSNSLTNLSSEKPLLPFLGRDAELEKLKGELGSGKLILLEGEPGIGKTRLISEFIASHTMGKTAALVLQGISYELEQGLPYHSIVDALRKLLARPDWQSLSIQLKIDAVWLTELSRLLPELLSWFPHLSPPAPAADEPRLWEALCQLFQALCRVRQVWLFLDDLHWADEATIAWLGYLVRNFPSPALNLLAASRPLIVQTNLILLLQALKREDRLAQIRLPVLAVTAMKKMASALSQKHNEQLSGWLIQNGEGNPFFITELVRYAMGIGLLKKDGALDLDLFDISPAIPATIQNLVESRLLKLSENARRLLHIAAIIGREFEFELVQQVSAVSEAETLDAVEELQASHLINPLPGDRFAFDHSLTMQVALNDMNEPRRRFFHRRVAETLETIHQNDLDLVSGLLTQHFLSANLPDRAKIYALRAGQLAANLAAWVEAIAYYQLALDLERVDVEHVPILIAMGNAHFHKGDFALASRDYYSAVDLAQAVRNWPLLEDAYLGLSLSLYPQARFAEAVAAAKKLRETGPPELAICAEFIWGASLGVESANAGEAEHHLRESGRLLREQAGTFHSKVTTVQIKYSLAGVFGQQGRSLEAVEQFQEVLDGMERGDDRLDTLRNIMLLNNLGYQLHLLGDASALVYIQKGIQLSRESGSLSHLPYLYSTTGEIALAGGDLDSAEKYFNDGLILARQIPIPERIAGMTANLGLVAKERGDTRLARQRLQSALDLVEPLGNHHLEVRIRIWLAPLLPLEDARVCLNSARMLAERGRLDGLLDEIGKLEKHFAA